MGVPVKTKALCLVTNQLNLGIDFSEGGRVERMLCSIKDEDLAVHTEGGNNIGVLGLVSSLVNFPRVLDLLNNVAFDGGNIACLAVATNFSALIVVLVGVGCHSLGDLNVGNLDKVGALIRRVGAEEQSVNPVVLALGLLDIWEPLDSKGRPS